MRLLLIALVLVGCSTPVATVATTPAKPKVYKPSELIEDATKLAGTVVTVEGSVCLTSEHLVSNEKMVIFLIEDRAIKAVPDGKMISVAFSSNGSPWSARFTKWVKEMRNEQWVRVKGTVKIVGEGAGGVYVTECEVIN